MHLKILGHPIFTNLNFHMPMIVDLSHPLIILQGENGAGKSTLINTLLGFHKPSAGTARILGHDVRTQARAVRSLIGYMPENNPLYPEMPVCRPRTRLNGPMKLSSTSAWGKCAIAPWAPIRWG